MAQRVFCFHCLSHQQGPQERASGKGGKQYVSHGAHLGLKQLQQVPHGAQLGLKRLQNLISIVCYRLVEARQSAPIRTTSQLVSLIGGSRKGKQGGAKQIHPATRVFQVSALSLQS